MNECDIDTMVEVEQMKCREAIARHVKATERVRALEKELEQAENELEQATEQMLLLGTDYER
jgi:hypothetical protein